MLGGVFLAALAGVLLALPSVLPREAATPAAATQHCGPAYPASIAKWDVTRDALYAASRGDHVIAFLGDSYTQGVMLQALDQDYAAIAAREIGWRPWLAGRGGTGYVNGGPCGGGASYAVRVPDALRAHPDVVVVEGSINDWRSRPRTVAAAARRVWALIARDDPQARVVALGPCRVPKLPAARIDALDAALRDAATGAGVTYVSALDWISRPGLVIPDGMHPTIAGHVAIGARLAAALRTAGIVPDDGTVPGPAVTSPAA